MKTQLNPVDLAHLHPMLYGDMPVCTTEMLAELYGCETKNLRDNFRNHTARFDEGKHVIKLQGEELKQFISRADSIGSRFKPSSNARVVNLWTERGAARHAKILDSDKSWEVFEKLEDCYFHAKKQQSILPQTPLLPPILTLETLQTMLDKPMQITVREYLALTQGKAQPLVEQIPAGSGRAYKQFLSVGERAEVIRLAEVDKMTPIEISEITGTLEDTVRTILYRHRKAKERDHHAKKVAGKS